MNRKIMIGTPCYGGLVTSGYMLSVVGIQGVVSDMQFTLNHVSDDALVTRARNRIVSSFYFKSDCTHLLFIDADISFPSNAPSLLALHNKDVVGGLYPVRETVWNEETRRHVIAGEQQKTACLRYVGETRAMHESLDRSPLIKTAYVGTGFMMISRRAISRLIKAYPELEYSRTDALGSGAERQFALFEGSINKEDGRYLSEDYTFCKRFREIGGEIYADTSLQLTHTGTASFSGDPHIRVGIDNLSRR